TSRGSAPSGRRRRSIASCSRDSRRRRGARDPPGVGGDARVRERRRRARPARRTGRRDRPRPCADARASLRAAALHGDGARRDPLALPASLRTRDRRVLAAARDPDVSRRRARARQRSARRRRLRDPPRDRPRANPHRAARLRRGAADHDGVRSAAPVRVLRREPQAAQRAAHAVRRLGRAAGRPRARSRRNGSGRARRARPLRAPRRRDPVHRRARHGCARRTLSRRRCLRSAVARGGIRLAGARGGGVRGARHRDARVGPGRRRAARAAARRRARPSSRARACRRGRGRGAGVYVGSVRGIDGRGLSRGGMFLSRFGRCAAAALAVAFAASSAPALAAAPPPKKDEAPVRVIAISVNGEDLAPDPAPRVEGSRLLVPIVRIYSALGITVARHGRTLVASAPARRITLRVGSRRATVDARTVFLDSPVVEIDGATYVPLRFVADSLGAQVAYDPKAERVEVVSLVVGRTPGLEQRIAGGSTQIVGTVSAVDLNSAPESITVTRGPPERTIAITSDARIVVQDVVTRTSAAASLDDIHVGDAVSVVMRKDGRVDAVVARYASRAGTIAAVSPTAFVLQTGYVVTPDKTTEITLNGRPATLSDLKTGDSVTVRLNPDTGEKRQIIVARAVP